MKQSEVVAGRKVRIVSNQYDNARPFWAHIGAEGTLKETNDDTSYVDFGSGNIRCIRASDLQVIEEGTFIVINTSFMPQTFKTKNEAEVYALSKVAHPYDNEYAVFQLVSKTVAPKVPTATIEKVA